MHVLGQQDQRSKTDRLYCMAGAKDQVSRCLYLDMSILGYYSIQFDASHSSGCIVKRSKLCYTWLYSCISVIIEFMLDLWG